MCDECSEKVKAMAKLMALLHYIMSKEIVDKFGEAGKDAIKASIRKFGEARIKNMHEKAKKEGLPINVETYGIVRDMPGDSWEWDPQNPDDVVYCPMQEVWESYQDKELGYMYCEIDHILLEGFGAKLDRPFCKAKGDKCCRFILRQDS